MEAIITYCGAIALIGVSAALIQGTSPYSRAGCNEYIGRQKRRILGQMILITGVFILVIGLVVQFGSEGP